VISDRKQAAGVPTGALVPRDFQSSTITIQCFKGPVDRSYVPQNPSLEPRVVINGFLLYIAGDVLYHNFPTSQAVVNFGDNFQPSQLRVEVQQSIKAGKSTC
jgi:hypothetical protein